MTLPQRFEPPLLVAQVPGAPPGTTPGIPRIEANLQSHLVPGLLLALALVLGLGYRFCFPNSRPNQILVIAGRRHRRSDGQTVGYRVITGGRAFALPVLETRSWMDVRTTPVMIHVENAYAKGGTPIDVEAIASIKIDTDPARVGNAIERFLHHDGGELVQVSRKTLEGSLRSLVANLTPEQVNEDRLRFAHQVAEIVQPDMAKLGIRLDTFKILRVTDKVDYLDSLGRAVLAEVLLDAAIAEAQGLGDADRREAEAQQRAEVACTQARTIIQQKQNGLRTIRAQLKQKAQSAEERVEAAAGEARARAQQVLQALRSELERKRLEADIVLPAQARQEADQWLAKGAAAPTAENAKASALVNDRLAEIWKDAGEDAATIFLLQQLETILGEVALLPEQLKLGRISVLEFGNAESLAELVALYPAVMRTFLDAVRDIFGIDVIGTLNPPAPSFPSFTSETTP